MSAEASREALRLLAACLFDDHAEHVERRRRLLEAITDNTAEDMDDDVLLLALFDDDLPTIPPDPRSHR